MKISKAYTLKNFSKDEQVFIKNFTNNAIGLLSEPKKDKWKLTPVLKQILLSSKGSDITGATGHKIQRVNFWFFENNFALPTCRIKVFKPFQEFLVAENSYGLLDIGVDINQDFWTLDDFFKESPRDFGLSDLKLVNKQLSEIFDYGDYLDYMKHGYFGVTKKWKK